MSEETKKATIEEEVANETINAEESNNINLDYSKIINRLLANGAKKIPELKIKNVNTSEEDNYTRVSFTVNRSIPGYVLNGEGEYVKGMTNVVFTTTYAIAGMLKEDEEYSWLANEIIDNPDIINLLFNGGTITVIQQLIEKGKVYINPFSTRNDRESEPFQHDTYICNVIKFKPGKTGLRMIDKLADKIFERKY